MAGGLGSFCGGADERDPACAVHDQQAVWLMMGAAIVERREDAAAEREWRAEGQIHG